MIELKELLPLLPKYKRKSEYGNIGDIKECVVFSYANDKNLSYRELSTELIENTMVQSIEPIGESYRHYCSLGLWLKCVKKEEI